MLKRLFNILLFIGLATNVSAQELNCTVKVMADGISGQGQDKETFRNMQLAITEFMNNRKWTDEQFGPQEKINCNILINVTQTLQGVQNGFSATLTIQSSRPVYNTSYMSQMVKHVDKEVQFSYNQFSPLEFNDNRVAGNNVYVSNLPAILAYYAYLVIGFDFDSFSPKGGEPYFKKAQNIVNNAPEQGKTITGWKAVEGNHNRYWIVDQVLNPRFQALRSVMYSMHREALDNMYLKPEESQKIILNSINSLSQLQKENPGSVLLQFFFNAKSDEFASVIAQQPEANRGLYVTMISQIDVPNVQKYNSLLK
ncbi:MAG: DUF4835 family protein [Chitinophagaceae bacterium]|nr:DUF4835 family protein [Chitinophagaceae bacterium]MCB9045685.1 DUF4835 family protein [Chitinophagales bacterium]